MVSDNELQRHVKQVETKRSYRSPDVPTIGTTESTVEERVDELQHAARETHDELARRIQRVDDAKAEDVRVEAIVDRMEDIEERLAAIEDQLAD
jgi:molybdopterin-biosynthesis enzyme MoeA-like protein